MRLGEKPGKPASPKGPVIGPLVMAGIAIDERQASRLKNMGVKDSKLLDPKKREELYIELCSAFSSYAIEVIPPSKIDSALSDPTNNLNMLEAEYTARILDRLNPKKAFIDLCDRSPERYCNMIRSGIKNQGMVLIAEHKADLNYPIVSAASILAKVTRDRQIERLKEIVGIDFGSGYMTDPKTKKFLEDHWQDPDIRIFRKSWASWKRMDFAKDQKNLFDF